MLFYTMIQYVLQNYFLDNWLSSISHLCCLKEEHFRKRRWKKGGLDFNLFLSLCNLEAAEMFPLINLADFLAHVFFIL
jgi:hypothetical protein